MMWQAIRHFAEKEKKSKDLPLSIKEEEDHRKEESQQDIKINQTTE